MLTFNNDPALQARYRNMALQHRAADRLRAKSYGTCGVGCYAADLGISEDLHAGIAAHFGLPEWLEHMRDMVFEGLPEGERADWQVNLSHAVPLGLDITRVLHLTAIDRDRRLLQLDAVKDASYVSAALNQCIAAHESGEPQQLQAAAKRAEAAAKEALAALAAAEADADAEAWATCETQARIAERISQLSQVPRVLWAAARGAKAQEEVLGARHRVAAALWTARLQPTDEARIAHWRAEADSLLRHFGASA